MTLTLDKAAIEAVASLGVFPEEFWDHEDDACDCTFQRIGMWTNPYIGETLEVRMCCIWAELYKLFPQFVRVTPAYLDYNKDEWAESWDWDGESDMPKAIWFRQIAKREGISVDEARQRYADKDYLRPRGTPRPTPEPEPEPFDHLGAIYGILADLMGKVDALENARS